MTMSFDPLVNSSDLWNIPGWIR